MKIKFTLNNKTVDMDVIPGLTLLEFLRREGIYSVKYGCDHGECGSCTVLIDGVTQNSCLILMHSLAGTNIETIENLKPEQSLNPIQKKFIKEGAIQCGYCTPGMILSTEALLRKRTSPNESEIKDALAGNLCRCTGHVKPIKAVLS